MLNYFDMFIKYFLKTNYRRFSVSPSYSCTLLSNTASQSTNNARNEYKYHTIFVLVSFPRPRERLKTLASKNFGETKTLDNKSLIGHFNVQYRCTVLLIICILTRPSGSPKYCMTRKNIQRYYTLKRLIRRVVGGMKRVQISCDICTRFARYLYSTKQCWIITKNKNKCFHQIQI